MGKGKRKARKQKRKNKQQLSFKNWLTPELDKRIKELAKVMTFMPPPFPREVRNKKYYDGVNKKLFCINLTSSGFTYCEDCWYKKCDKEVRDIITPEELKTKEE